MKPPVVPLPVAVYGMYGGLMTCTKAAPGAEVAGLVNCNSVCDTTVTVTPGPKFAVPPLLLPAKKFTAAPLAKPVPVTVIMLPFCVTWVIVGGLPSGTYTVCDPTRPEYGLFTTSNAPNPSGAFAGILTCSCVPVAPGSGVSGPMFPTPV